MAKYVRKDVSNTIENNIITASILSTNYLEEIFNLYSKQYIQNAFGKIIIGWCFDYFDKFGEAPAHHIQTIFDLEKEKLDDANVEIIATFLHTLSKNYVAEQGINAEYVLDQTMQYFRKREVEIRVENAQKLLEVGKLEAAEDELFKMKKVIRATSNWSNPLDDSKVHEVFDETKKGILRFPGALGDLLGDLERGWFIAFLAPFKRGKTWLLQEAVIIAALSNLKAVFITLEMQDKNMNERLYKRITAYGEEGKSDHIVPVFDCVRNQTGVCEKSIRKNRFLLYDGEGDLPEFSSDMDYRPCSVCKDLKSEQDDYELSTWYEVMMKPEFTLKNVNKKLRAFKKFHGDNLRTKCYPRFSATVSDIRRDLDILEQTEGFIPDVIAIDFAGIIKPEKNSGGDTRIGVDEIWKNLAALAMERHAVLFSASQGNRGSLYKENMDQADIAEWIGILGHVDGFVSVNQSALEKKRGIMRLGLLAHRHKEFHEKDHTMILQHLALGQVHLDSYKI